MGGHLAAAARRIGLGPHALQELLHGIDAERQGQRAVTVVEIEPVGPGAEEVGQRDLDRLVAGTRNQEEDLALLVQLRFTVVDVPRRDHGSVPGAQCFAVGKVRLDPGVDLVFECRHVLRWWSLDRSCGVRS